MTDHTDTHQEMSSANSDVTIGDTTTNITRKELEQFGEIYSDSKGIRYVRISGMGARIDACKPFRATVSSFTIDSHSGWHEVKLNGYEEVFHLHSNWTALHGELKPGEEVEGIIDTLSGGKFWLVRRVPKKVDEMELGV